MRPAPDSRTPSRFSRLMFCLMLAATCGCAQFYDRITSRDFKARDLVSTPDPMTELRQNQDGDARARAMRGLKEPARNGRSHAEQDEALKYLSQAATTDSRPLCRLAAVEALGRFEDPRSIDPLIHAFHQADAMVPDVANALRSEIMTALGKKRSPEALGLLVRIAADVKTDAKTGTIQPASFTANNSLQPAEAVTDRDLRLAAIRALGDTKDPSAIAALLPLLKEKDVAIRNRAHDSLVAITGRRDLPADAAVWERALARAAPAPR